MWVRTASNKDLAEIGQLLGVVWHATYDQIYGVQRVSEITAEWHSLGSLSKNLSAPNSEFLVADSGSQLGGMAFARQISDRIVKIKQIYILPDFQGQGVGQQLLDEVFESFFEAVEFELEVEKENIPAIKFYEKNGFVRAGETGNCGEDNSGIAALIYRKVCR